MTLEARVVVSRGSFTLDIDLTATSQEIVAVLGPNGAGKSTLLGAIAGLIPLDAGHVSVGGRVLDDVRTGVHVPPEHRHVGVVFQDLLLFERMSVLDNVAFGPRCHGASRAEAGRRAAAALSRFGLEHLASARPRELSGGQAQLVALARAVVTEPPVLLLDEPLAALDVTARPAVRRALRDALSSFAGVRLLVTHDPADAFTLADRLVIVEEGRAVQSGSPSEVAARPRSAYAADLGGVNLVRGRVSSGVMRTGGAVELVVPGLPDGEGLVVFHPRTVALYRTHPEGTPRNVWRGEVAEVTATGDRVRVVVDGPPRIVSEVTREACEELALAPGADVWVSVKSTEMQAYPA
ncbi:MAG TPA: ATP-binding cassette domain-containing protein [Actinomycetota bacterium]|nr:ATP-binding cassette domain-containing protein [Actinomycetota bacterium]